MEFWVRFVPRLSVPPLSVRVLFTVPELAVYARSAPRLRVPPVIESVLVAVAAPLDVAASRRDVMPTVPAVILRVARLALPKPALAELFVFMFSVAIVTVPPLMLVVAWTGAAVWSTTPVLVMVLLPIVMVPVILTVPPPILRVAIAAPFVPERVLVFCPISKVVNVAEPVPPEAIRLSVPVIVLPSWKAPVRVPRLTVVATRVPVSKVNVPVL